MAQPETDTDDVPGTEETENRQEQQKRQIVLTSGEQTVVVEGPDPLAEITRTAAHLWLLVTPQRETRIGFGAGSTLITERSQPWQEEDRAACRTR